MVEFRSFTQLLSIYAGDGAGIVGTTVFGHRPVKTHTCHTFFSYILQPNEIHHDHSSRPMALGLIDPWDDYKMDQDLLPSIDNGHGEGDGSKL